MKKVNQSALLVGCFAIATVGSVYSTRSTANARSNDGAAKVESAGPGGSSSTLDFFASNANYQGIQSGWYGNILKRKFNIQLNIIAPQVSGGGNTLYQTRSAAGNLGDLVALPYNEMGKAVKAGLILDLSKYINHTKYLKTYLKASQAFSKNWGVKGIYAMPTNASAGSPFQPVQVKAGSVEQATYLRWDYYHQLGAPKIKNMDQLLDVLKEMQGKHPKTDSGKRDYAFSLFPDWDGTGMSNVNFIVHFLGYEAGTGFIDGTVDGKHWYDKLNDNGPYYKVLKWYFKANQMGLVDPDSPTQNFSTVNAKVADGSVLFTWFPITNYNTAQHLAKGKGDIFVPVGGMKYGTLGNSIYGQGGTVAIGSKVKDPQRVVAFLDWLASPENAELVFDGPKGLTWTIKDGKPLLTKYGQIADQGQKSDVPVPAKWGGGSYLDGSAQYVAYIPYQMAKDPNTGEVYEPSMWPSTLQRTRTLINQQWTKVFGYQWPLQYVEAHHQIAVLPGTPWFPPDDSSDIATRRAQCQKLLTDTSWKMIFAPNEAQFNSLWSNMKAQMKGLGYDQVLAVDRHNFEGLKKALEKVDATAKK